MEQGVSLSNIVGGIVLLLALTAIIVLVMRASKAKEDMGITFNRIVINNKIIWITLFLLFLNIAEAAYVADSHAEGVIVRGQLPYAPRMLMHLSINLIAFIIQVSLASIVLHTMTLYGQTVGLFPKSAKGKKLTGADWKPLKGAIGTSFTWTILSAIALFITFAAPAFNVYILFANMMELPQLTLWWSDIWTDMRGVYAMTPRSYLIMTYLPPDQAYLGANYSAYTDMSNAGKVLIGGAQFHGLITIFEGIYVAAVGMTIKTGTSATSTSTSTSSTTTTKDPILAAVTTIMGNIFADATKAAKKAEDAVKAINGKWAPTSADNSAAMQLINETKKKMANWKSISESERLKILQDFNDLLGKVGQKVGQTELEAASKRF